MWKIHLMQQTSVIFNKLSNFQFVIRRVDCFTNSFFCCNHDPCSPEVCITARDRLSLW